MDDLAELLRTEALRRLEESRGRIRTCLGKLSEERIWRRPNANVASVGNLVLHLCGNVGQWINSTLGGSPDDRHRDAEFSEPGPLPTADLLRRLDMTLDRALGIIQGLSAGDLTRTWSVQGFQETGAAIVVHVVEHFSYHTGQITLHTKIMLDVDTGYYAGQDLNTTG